MMALLGGSAVRELPPLKNAIEYAGKSFDNVFDRFKRFVSEVIPPVEVNMEEVKGEIWTDLSALYYKYEDETQKKAFREVAQEISEKMQEGKWEAIYKKLYRIERGVYTRNIA